MKVFIILINLGFLFLFGCSSHPVAPDRVDGQTLSGKFIVGYQGWYSAPGDGSKLNRWQHWTSDQKIPSAENITVALWPDLREFSTNEKFLTELKLSDGAPAAVFSSYKFETVHRHFEWIKSYGIDGVFVQRFVNQLSTSDTLDFFNHVLNNVVKSAAETGRVFAIMYDVSGAQPETLVKDIINDWVWLVDKLALTSHDRYLKHRGLPLLGIWGLGFKGSKISPSQASELLDWFEKAPQKYK